MPWRFEAMSQQDKTKWYFCEFAPLTLSWQADDLQNPSGFQCALLADMVKVVFDIKGIQVSMRCN